MVSESKQDRFMVHVREFAEKNKFCRDSSSRLRLLFQFAPMYILCQLSYHVSYETELEIRRSVEGWLRIFKKSP